MSHDNVTRNVFASFALLVLLVRLRSALLTFLRLCTVDHPPSEPSPSGHGRFVLATSGLGQWMLAASGLWLGL